jgi:hypothetical protein
VIVWQRHVHGLGQHQVPIEVALLCLGDGRIVEGEREIDVAGAQPRQRLLRLGVGDGQADARITGVKERDGLGEDGRAGAGEAGQAPLSSPAIDARSRSASSRRAIAASA